jgi:hypothetical protein
MKNFPLFIPLCHAQSAENSPQQTVSRVSHQSKNLPDRQYQSQYRQEMPAILRPDRPSNTIRPKLAEEGQKQSTQQTRKRCIKRVHRKKDRDASGQRVSCLRHIITGWYDAEKRW